LSRRYPLEPPAEPTPKAAAGREPIALRTARIVAGWLVELGNWRRRHLDLSAALSGVMLLLLGIGLAMSGMTADTYMHRGVEPGNDEPFVIQPTGDGLATNVDLRVFLGGELPSVAEALSTGGFRFVRQPVAWGEIETEPGVYNWDAYDQVINEMSRRQIHVIAVIVDAPDWSRDPATLDVADGPPVDPSAIGSFMQEFTARYGKNVPYVQVWDQPNLATRWGGTPATPAGFLPYLAAAYNGARTGNPEVRIITPELAFRTSDNPDSADLDFLNGLYTAHADPFFDLVGIQLDGGTTSPDDRRVSERRHNFSRAILTRELMVHNGDAATPIWATSFGWARAGETSTSEQAEFVIRALERSWVEWPWMGLMFQWAFLAPGGAGAAPYALVQSNGSATPLYRRLADTSFHQRATRIAETGFVPMDADSVRSSGAWQDQHLEERTFRTTNQIGAEVTMQFRGTGITAIMRIGPESGNVEVEVDGKLVSGGAGDSGDEWDLTWPTTVDTPIELVSGLEYGEHTLTIRLSQEGAMTLGGIVVERQQPFVWPVVLLTAGSLIALFFGIRSLVMLVGRRSGYLPRPDDEESWPALPRMPDWQPSRRM
jgi:hypothetical protein